MGSALLQNAPKVLQALLADSLGVPKTVPNMEAAQLARFDMYKTIGSRLSLAKKQSPLFHILTVPPMRAHNPQEALKSHEHRHHYMMDFPKGSPSIRAVHI